MAANFETPKLQVPPRQSTESAQFLVSEAGFRNLYQPVPCLDCKLWNIWSIPELQILQVEDGNTGTIQKRTQHSQVTDAEQKVQKLKKPWQAFFKYDKFLAFFLSKNDSGDKTCKKKYVDDLAE